MSIRNVNKEIQTADNDDNNELDLATKDLEAEGSQGHGQATQQQQAESSEGNQQDSATELSHQNNSPTPKAADLNDTIIEASKHKEGSSQGDSAYAMSNDTHKEKEFPNVVTATADHLVEQQAYEKQEGDIITTDYTIDKTEAASQSKARQSEGQEAEGGKDSEGGQQEEEEGPNTNMKEEGGQSS
jgi:hypothetical protein